MNKTRLELVMEEAIRPTLGALELLRSEIRQTMGITEAPWHIFNKPYNELTDEEIMALFDVYHQQGETEPCSMCVWASRRELQELNKERMGGTNYGRE